ncbi:hypothetical protein PTKIN_Ptkin11bG0177600 [Pterospermum kingtungense]
MVLEFLSDVAANVLGNQASEYVSSFFNIRQVGRRASLEGLDFLLSNDFLAFESSKAALTEIMNALKSDGVYMIGLYGMPGVGKTTLAKQVGKKAREEKLFDKVVMFTVSKDPNTNNIQDEIADVLGLTFEATSGKGRAEELWRRLKGEKKILLIVDDFWDPSDLDLKRIGIPFGDYHVGCKILLTTRHRQTCNQMNCQRMFQLEILSESEAWDLFKANAGPDPTLDEMAKEVAGECKGLPLAIVTVGRALKGQTDRRRWEAVNQRLKESRHSENQDVCRDIYSSLEISYEFLKGNNSRRCLHLCSLFPEDHMIVIEELTMYGIGQGMFDDVDSIEKARTEMHDIVTKLQDSGLLLGTSGAGIAKMHDVVRDFIHWKTSKGEDTLLVRSGLTTWPRNRSLGSCTAISLIKCKINEFPDSLEFPKLKAFLLDGERLPETWDITLRFPSTFLQGMKVLEVLVLQNVFVSLEGLKSLTNLRTLRLQYCRLENVSSWENLKKLEILVIGYSILTVNYEELFCGITGLTTLRLLDVSNNDRHKVWTLPKNFISSLVQLEELHLRLRIKWASIGEESANIAALSELYSLSRLTQLSLKWLSPGCIPNEFVFPPLQRYDIVVRDDLWFPNYNPYWRSSRRRRLAMKKSSLNTFKKLFCNVEELVLNDIMDSLEYLINATEVQGPNSAFSNLVGLTLDNMICLKELWHGQPPLRFLYKLEYLTIKSCTNLVFELPATSLPNLKRLELEECGQMQEIFQTDRFLHSNEEIQAPLLSSLTDLKLVSLPELKSIWKGPTDHVGLQSLKYIKVSRCNKLKSVFPPPLAQTLVHLQQLHVSNCDGVEQVFDCEEETDDGEDITLRHLDTLELKSLISLRKLYSENYSVKLPSLKNLEVSNCGQLTHFKVGLEVSTSKDENVFEALDVDVHAFKEIFCKVKNLSLHGKMSQKSLAGDAFRGRLNEVTWLQLESCNDLECLIEQTRDPNNDDQSPERLLPKLKELKVRNCKDMVSLLPATINLKKVTAESCVQLQVIFQMEGSIPTGEENQEMLLLSNLKELKLKLLPKLKCIWKGPTHHVNLQSLKVMTIKRCDKLTSLFSPSLAKTLLHLKELQIKSCKELERIISTEPGRDDHETVSCNILLPRLHSLGLEDLENFSNLCPRNYFVMAPSLENFYVCNCPKLTHDTLWCGEKDSELFAFKEMICCSKNPIGFQNFIPVVDPEGLNELTTIQLHNIGNVECLYDITEHRQPTVTFSNLVKLVVKEMTGLKKLCNNPPPKGFLQKLEELEITNCMNLASLSPLGQNLKEVMIEDCCQLHEIFEVDEILQNSEVNQVPLMSNLTYLQLELLSELRCIWKGPSHSVINLGSLEIVNISNCKRLRCLLSPSLVKSLVHLKRLSLNDLPELKQLITELESDAEQDKQVLNMVKEKVDGPHKPFIPLLPSLEYFEVSKCPQLEPVVIQQEVNNQPQVKGLYLANMQCSSFDILLRQSLPHLEHLTVGNHLQFLRGLIISNCSKLKSLFPRLFAQSLPHLSYLGIEQCDELEQIIDKDETSASSSQGHLQPICFPSLTKICIEGCNNLKSLFSVTVALSLSQLELFTIRGASKLEQVFKYEGGIDIEDTEKEIVLPELCELSLEELLRLQSFIPMGYHCSFPELFSLKVKECPSLTTSFRVDSVHTVHAKTETVGDSPMKGSNTDVEVTEGSATNVDIIEGSETIWPVGSDINWEQ